MMYSLMLKKRLQQLNNYRILLAYQTLACYNTLV